jgi:virulence factor Mce-like protein
MSSGGDRDASVNGGGTESDPFELGNRHAERGEMEKAEQAYRRADEQGHGTAAAYAGVFAEARGDYDEAHEAYTRSDERGDGFGALRLGLLSAARGDWETANDAYARADERGHEPPPFDPRSLRPPREPQAEPQAAAIEGGRSAFANPVLIGAVTVLIVIIAVFLAYNANTGLPFVPTKELKVDIANGSNLVVGNDVRSGGFRIGVISDMKPIRLANGQIGAQLVLHLDQAHDRVPVDSTATILPSSVLGTKYLDLHTGTSSQLISDGGLLPLGHTHVPVQFDDVFKTFDSKTRVAVQDSLTGAGDALTARGSSLNDTISSLSPLLAHLQPVAAYLSDPSTNLTGFFDNLERFMGAVAPVARVNADLFTQMATTFAAIDKEPNNLQATIAKSPSTEAVSTESLKVQQPFLVDLSAFGKAMTPATASLKDALPAFVPAIQAGTKTLARTPSLNANLQQVMSALKGLAQAPGTNIALNGLVSTVDTLNPMVRYLGPYQTVCDDWNYWWTYLAEHISEQTAFGFAQRVLFNSANASQMNSITSQGATAPVNGGSVDAPTGGNAFLHSQNYGAAIDNQGNADCETGQRGYPKKLNAFDPQGRNLALDPHTPGNQGPTFNGRTHVPAGETFSRNPQTGPQLQYNPSNP